MSYRAAVLAVVESSEGMMSGQDIARLAGLSYRQTVDALNALYNSARIARTGRKFTARWHRVRSDDANGCDTALLQRLMYRMIKR